MRCIAPFFHKEIKIHLACGKCVACLVNRRRKWTARMLMENETQPKGFFVTLTYDTPFLPENGSVSKPELQKFFKRLRKYSGQKLRYFACGEYGSKRGRPHYHAIIWGDITPNDVMNAWKFGRIDFRAIHSNAIEYVAGYCCKKISHTKELKENGKEKEFCLMSRKPALGSAFLSRLYDLAFLQNPYDVCSVFKFGNKLLPLDRLMREKLRSALLSEEQIRDVKNLNIELMQDRLTDFILEQFGEEHAKLYDDFCRRDVEHFQDVNELSTLVNTAFYSSTQHQEDLMLVRRNQRRFERKDL